MATATWLAAAGGDWFNAANWDVNGATAVPTAADTAFIGLSGAYTVTLIAATHVGAITLTDPQGDLRLAAPGSQVDVDGTVTNAGRLEINGASGTATAMAVGGSVINSGNLELRNHGTLTIGGDLLNTGFVGLDWEAFSLEGGSGLTVTGTLVDNGAMTVGIVSGGLSATTTVTAGALAGSGSLTIAGNGTNQAAVYILAAAPSVLGLNATLNDNATLQFASGLIGTIASGKTLRLNGARAVVSDASDPATNSALTGLSLIAGAMQLVNGASLALSNPLTITSSGALSLDADSFTAEGGASLTITGGLTNAGALAIGPGTGGLGAPTTLTADSLINTGSIRLVGNFDAASTNVATMAIASAAGFGAAGILSGSVFVDGKSNLTFASGQIGTIASGARLDLRGLGLISNAAALTRNSALDGLSSIAGVLDVAYGQTVAVGNDVSIAAGGQWLIDGDSFSGEGNSRVTISGTLANAGGLTIGVPTGDAPGPTYVSAAALVNTGAIALTGNFNAASTASATLAIAAAAGFGAAGVASGTIRLNGQAHLEFGSGQIGTVAPGAELRLWGLARLADASDPTRNSALDGLSLVAGTFNLAYGETLTVTNSVSITSSGQWLIDGDSFSAQGNSRVSVNGTLTNAGGLTIGVPTGDAPGPTYVSAAALTNTGVITLTGNVNAASTATATLAVASAAGLG
ncbi:MAG: hypothetical protein JSS43_05700, partial [Proteobacteria bacterium]|nr:hypothetical protein [Pseudomonadota bacterium]